jgi:hypothetical protein
VGEGRRFSAVFDSNFYRAANPDLAAARLTNEQLFEHFRSTGLREGRAASNTFQAAAYLALNPDLVRAGLNFETSLTHYILVGAAEGRRASNTGGGAPAPTPRPAVDAPAPTPRPAVNAADTEPNNYDSIAVNLDILTGQTYTINGFVGGLDDWDDYRFTVDPVTNFSASISGATQTVSLNLYGDFNNNGRIDSGEQISYTYSDYSNPTIRRTLGPGTYWVGVGRDSNIGTRYTLQLSGTSTGFSGRAGGNLGVVVGDRRVSGFVGGTNGVDVYQIDLNTIREFRSSLTGTSWPVYMALHIDRNNNGRIDSGERIDYTYSDYSNPTIRQTLGAGRYFLEVARNGVSGTLYDVDISVV